MVGSPYTVRGFLAGSLVNDRGFYAQNDLSTQFRLTVSGLTTVLRPHIGLDAGYVAGATPGTASGFLTGASAGLGLVAGRLSFDAYTSRELSHAGLRSEGLLTFLRATASF